jgi:5-methyltetrahydrofolate--homocysteine methyltransferase
MGTALLARGLPAEVPPEAWVSERPWEVAAVHAGHAAAGAELLLTCTFNLARLDLAGIRQDPAEVALRAVPLARAARPRLVAGCVGATGLTLPGARPPAPGELTERYDVAVRALAGAGVDLLWLETQLDLVEARAALAAARRTGLPVVATAWLRPSPGGMEALDGRPGPEFLSALWREGAVAVGVNCVAPDRHLAQVVAATAASVPVPLVVKPNAGMPGEPVAPERFALGVAEAVLAGASMAGGCCGAGPAHLRALGVLVAPRPAQARG